MQLTIQSGYNNIVLRVSTNPTTLYTIRQYLNRAVETDRCGRHIVRHLYFPRPARTFLPSNCRFAAGKGCSEGRFDLYKTLMTLDLAEGGNRGGLTRYCWGADAFGVQKLLCQVMQPLDEH